MKTKATDHLMQISMKTFFKTLLAALIMVAAVSCAKETPAPKEPAAQPEANLVPYTLNIGTQAAKSFIDKDSTTIVWEEGDRLGVIDDVNATVHEFTFVSSDGVSANFDGSLNEGASTLYVVYPYDENSSVAATTVSASLPAAQQVSANRTARGALLAVGTAPVNQRVSLKNAFGLVQVTVKHSDVKEIVLDGEGLSGVVSLDVTTGEISGVPVSSGAITLTPPAGDEYFKKDSVYYAAVLPGTTPAGAFSLEIRREMDAALASSATYTFTKAVTVPRNGGFYFNTDNAAFSWSWHITNKAELFAWNAAYAKWSKLDKVYIDADIDMQSELWTPRIFRGVLDGQNHKLYNFVTDPASPQTGFVSDLGGTVKNLVLGSSDGSTYDGTSLVSHASDSTFWCNVASVAARLGNNGKIENVTNFATVEVLASAAKKTRVGGIAGFVMGTETSVVNCRNFGAIKDNATSASSDNLPIGGILGSADNAVTISGCYNYGDITNNNPKVEWIGGIMGVTNGPVAIDKAGAEAFKATITDCHNEGNITANAGTALRIGGIVGNLTGGDLSGCTNLGSITNNANVTNYLGGVVGAVDKAVENTLTNCVNGSSSDHSKGSISYDPAETSATSRVGGVIGNAAGSAKLTVSGCSNYCDLSTANGYVNNLGGLFGAVINTKGVVRVSDCHNYGSVSNTSTATTSDNRIGGFAGTLQGAAGVVHIIENSSNEGAVSTSKPAAAAAFVGGIIGRADYFVLDNVHNTANVTSHHESSTNKQNVGGLVGYASAGAEVRGGSYNSGDIKATGAGQTLVGGLFGNTGNAATTSGGALICGGSYNAGNVTASCTTDTTTVGGLCGLATAATIYDAYSAGSGKKIDASGSKVVNAGGLLGGSKGCVIGQEGKETYNATEVYSHDGVGFNNIGGIVGNLSISGVSTDIQYVENRAKVHTLGSATNTAQIKIGGILGCNIAGSKFSISNSVNTSSAEVYATGTGITQQIHTGGIVATIHNNSPVISACTNNGKVHADVTSTQPVQAGGIISWSNGATIKDGCKNTGEIHVNNAGDGECRAAGIAMTLQNGAIRGTSDNYIENSGKVIVEGSGSGVSYISGVLSISQANGVVVEYSKNTGSITLNRNKGNAFIGGIVAVTPAKFTVRNCVNEGAVSSTQTAYTKVYRAAGGIVGMALGKSGQVTTISNCTNLGAVTVTANSDNQLTNAAGILGDIRKEGYVTVTGCVNGAAGDASKGVITCVNEVESSKTVRTAFAGGIFGGDNEGTTNTATNSSITDCTNYGLVTAKVTNGPTLIGAGGVVGYIYRKTTFSDISSLGSAEIKAYNGNTLITGADNNTIGGAGALVGHCGAAGGAASGSVAKTVVVGGVSYDAAATAETLNYWLCPSNNGNITATYVD